MCIARLSYPTPAPHFNDPDVTTVQTEMTRLTKHWMHRFEAPFITIQDLTQHKPLPQWRKPLAVLRNN